MLLPAIALYGLVLFYPLVGLAIRSLRNTDDESLSWSNYAYIVTTPLFRLVLENTFTTGLMVTLICVVVGYPVAYVLFLARPVWRKVLLAFLLIPMFTSVLVRSFAWIALLSQDGPINDILSTSGVANEPLSLLYSRAGVLIGMVNVMLPYCALPMFSVMVGIDRRVLEAAGSLGAGPLRTFWRIFFPLSVPGLAAGALLTFVLSIGFYLTPALLGGRTDTMIAQLIETQVKSLAAFEVASALAVVLMGMTVVILLAYNRFFGLTRVFGAAA